MNPFKRSIDSAVEKKFNELVTEWPGSDYSVRVESETSAMKIGTVFRCVDILSSGVAALPLKVMTKRDGYFQETEGLSMSYVLSGMANKRMTSFDLIKNTVIQTVNAGNAYIYPVYRFGELYELILLSPNTVAYDKYNDTYIINDLLNGIFKVVGSEDIIHIRNLSLDGGYTGVSTITYASRVMSVSANADERSLDSFKPGSKLKGFISTDESAGVEGYGNMQDDQLDSVTERIRGELEKGKDIFFLPSGSKFNPLSLSAADLQLLETKKFGVLDLCRFYGVHPDMAFAGQSQNYEASKNSIELFKSMTLTHLLQKIQSEFNAKLFDRSIAHKMKIEFDMEGLMQGNAEMQADYMKTTIESGVYDMNYWRRKKGQKPVPGGDIPFISCNVAPYNSEKIHGKTQENKNNE